MLAGDSLAGEVIPFKLLNLGDSPFSPEASLTQFFTTTVNVNTT